MPQSKDKGSVRICLYLPENLVKKIDAIRGDIPRSKFITRQLEAQAVPA